MARSYTPLLHSIWRDPEFVALPAGAQRVYLLAISQPNISYAGVVPYMPRRWARYSSNTTEAHVEDQVAVLADAGFVVVDDVTDELWVCSFVKHNKINEQTQLHRALAAAFDAILSTAIRGSAYDTLCDKVKEQVTRGADPCPAPGPAPLKDLDLDLGPEPSSSSLCEEPEAGAGSEEDLFHGACVILAERALAAQPEGSVRIPDRWLAKAVEERKERHHDRVDVSERSFSSATELADWLEGATHPLDDAQRALYAGLVDCSEPMPWTDDEVPKDAAERVAILERIQQSRTPVGEEKVHG